MKNYKYKIIHASPRKILITLLLLFLAVSGADSKSWNDLENDFKKRCDELNLMFKTWIEDVQTMDVITATGNLKVKIDSTKQGSILDQLTSADGELTIRARTTVQLDGDILSILPEKASDTGSQVDEQMLKIHKESVDMAMKNVSNNLKIFTDGVVQAISYLQKFNGLK
jgi:hypothetical protein